MYGLGLSRSSASRLLGALGADIGKERSDPRGGFRADHTAHKTKGREVAAGFVADGVSGRILGFEVLFDGDGKAFRWWGSRATPYSGVRKY